MFEPIKILGVVEEEVGVPRNDGTKGSKLYEVPLRLSAQPPSEWDQFFLEAWDWPPQSTSMHRRGIASVAGDRIILERTTLEEVKQYHRDTLILAVNQANERYTQLHAEQRRRERLEEERIAQHQERVREQANKIRFD